MNNISSCCYNPPDQFSMVQGNLAYQSAQIEKTKITGKQNADIEIQTADGDKVTLSSDIIIESSAITYEELGRTNASYSKSRGQIISADSNSKLELTVEGSLDELEKKEIKEVLINLFKMVKDFITGKADTEAICNFADLSTISEVKAEFDINTGVTIAAQSSANHIAETSVEEKPVTQGAKTANLSAVSDRVDKLTDRMIMMVKNSGIEPSKILKRMNRQLLRLSRKYMHARPAVRHNMRFRQAILEDFAKKLKELSAENEAEIKNKEQAEPEKAANLNEPGIFETTSSVSETNLTIASQNFHFEAEYSATNDN